MLVSTIDFRYITDAVTPDEAIAILKQNQGNKQQRIDDLMQSGFPCYTTQVGEFQPKINAKKEFSVLTTPTSHMRILKIKNLMRFASNT